MSVRAFLFMPAALLAAIAVCAGSAAAGEVRKTYDFENFERISVAGVYHLIVEVGPSYSVALSGPSSEMDRVEATVKQRTLRLDQKGKMFGDKRARNHGVEARITMPSLVSLHMSGVAEGRIDGIDSDRFDVAISGVGEMRLFGACERLNAEVSGVGELDAKGLICKDVRVVVSGVGAAKVHASEAVDAVVSGMGDISVVGSPKRVKKSGGMFADISVR